MDRKDSARAERRHHVERVKAARRSYWGRGGGRARAEPLDERQLGMVAATPKVCGWACCGNPRRWAGEQSFQELRLFQDLEGE